MNHVCVYGYECCLWNRNVYVNKCLWLCMFECFRYVILVSYAFEVEWSDWVLEPSVETMRINRPEQNSWAAMGSKYCGSTSDPWYPLTVWFEVKASSRSDQYSEPSRVKVVDVDVSRRRNVKSYRSRRRYKGLVKTSSRSKVVDRVEGLLRSRSTIVDTKAVIDWILDRSRYVDLVAV